MIETQPSTQSAHNISQILTTGFFMLGLLVWGFGISILFGEYNKNIGIAHNMTAIGGLLVWIGWGWWQWYRTVTRWVVLLGVGLFIAGIFLNKILTDIMIQNIIDKLNP